MRRAGPPQVMGQRVPRCPLHVGILQLLVSTLRQPSPSLDARLLLVDSDGAVGAAVGARMAVPQPVSLGDGVPEGGLERHILREVPELLKSAHRPPQSPLVPAHTIRLGLERGDLLAEVGERGHAQGNVVGRARGAPELRVVGEQLEVCLLYTSPSPRD